MRGCRPPPFRSRRRDRRRRRRSGAVLRDEFAVLRELENSRIGASRPPDPEVARVVDRETSVLFRPIVAVARAAPMGDERAARVELEDIWRRGAALAVGGAANRQADLGAGREAVGQVDDEDVVARVDGHAGRGSENPPIAHRLGPHRVDVELRRLLGGRLCGGLTRRRLRRDRGQTPGQQQQSASERNTSVHAISSSRDGPCPPFPHRSNARARAVYSCVHASEWRDSTRSESGPSRCKRRCGGSRCVGFRACVAGRELRA